MRVLHHALDPPHNRFSKQYSYTYALCPRHVAISIACANRAVNLFLQRHDQESSRAQEIWLEELQIALLPFEHPQSDVRQEQGQPSSVSHPC